MTAPSQFPGRLPTTTLDLGGRAEVCGVSMPSEAWKFIKKDAASRGLSTSRLFVLLVLEHKAAMEAQEAAERKGRVTGQVAS